MAKKSKLSIRLETDKEFLEEFKNYCLSHTYKEAQTKYGCSQTQFMRYLNKYDIKKLSQKTKAIFDNSKSFRESLLANKSLLNQVITYYSTHSLIQTAKHFGCGRHALANILREQGIQIHACSILQEARKDLTLRTNIFDYYNNHSLHETANYFSCSRRALKLFLEEFNIPIHTDEQTYKLKQDYFLTTYGVENAFQISEVKEKIKQTNLERYGQTNPSKVKEIRDKTKQTNLKKYGKAELMSTSYFKEKSRQTLFDTYGCYHVPSYKFKYNNISFDSFPELCFYLYHIKNNSTIKREPIEFKYTCQNKEYLYYPDFLVDNKLYELKGEHFLSNDEKWCCPYDHSLDEVFEAKHQCALNNGVIILYSKDYQKYIDWFYSQGYLKEDFK